MTPRVVVIENERLAGIGNYGEWLCGAGVTLDVVRPHAGEPVPAEVEGAGLIVLGGPMGARDDERAPWLPATRRLLAGAVENGTPVFGICLGAQLLALATGGDVERAPAGPEIGAVAVAIDDPDDRLLAGVATPAPVVQWHADAVTGLPVEAVALAHNPGCPYQAFRLGDRAWGVQWHPEVTRDDLASWAALTGELTPEQATAVLTAVDAQEPEITAASRTLALNFARVISPPCT